MKELNHQYRSRLVEELKLSPVVHHALFLIMLEPIPFKLVCCFLVVKYD